MKKILLGVLALSVVSFGATKDETASVPVTVKAVVTEAPTGLAIVDEVTGQVDQVVIDHGTIKKGTLSASSPSIQTKGFRVVKMDTSGAQENLGAVTLSVGLSKSKTKLTKIGSTVDTDILESNLEVFHKTGTLTTGGANPNGTGEGVGNHYTVTLPVDAKEHRGEIRSIISAATGAAGVYDNLSDRPTLAVRIDATPSAK